MHSGPQLCFVGDIKYGTENCRERYISYLDIIYLYFLESQQYSQAVYVCVYMDMQEVKRLCQEQLNITMAIVAQCYSVPTFTSTDFITHSFIVVQLKLTDTLN